jgi:hypothetical protein
MPISATLYFRQPWWWVTALKSLHVIHFQEKLEEGTLGPQAVSGADPLRGSP